MKNEKLLCDYPFTHFEINNPDGDVTMCCNHHLKLGNINENTIEEIWNGESYQQVRKQFLEGEIYNICSRDCPVLQGWKDYEKMDWYVDLPGNSIIYRNALLNEQEAAAGQTLLRSKPRWIRFAASYRCNLHCYHCFQEDDPDRNKKLPDKFFQELKDKYLDSLQFLFLYGGEPFIEKQNMELLQYIAEKNYLMKLIAVTNGTILTDSLKDCLKKINIGLIAVSIDSVTEELYEELRRPAEWEKTLKNIKFYSNLTNDIDKFHLNFTLNKKNMSELKEQLKFAEKYNATPFFQFAHNTRHDRNFRKKYEIYTAAEYKKLTIILKLAENILNKNNYPLTLKNFTSLLETSAAKMKEQTLWKRVVNFVRRKYRIYKKMLVS